VQHLINAYKHSVEWSTLKGITQQSYARYLRVWENPLLAKINVVDITRRQIRTLRSDIARKRGISTANVFVRVTAAWFKWMLANDWLEFSPTSRIDPLPGGGSYPTWTDAQFNHAVSVFPEHLRKAIILARYTGQRRSDLITMRWSDYRDDVFIIKQQKGRKGSEPVVLHVPAHFILREELARWRIGARSVFVLTTDRGVQWNPTYLSRLIGDAVHKANLPPKLNLHGLRYLAATTLAQIGCSPHEIMAITGHKTLAMVQHYTDKVSQQRLAQQAMDRFERTPSFTGVTRIYKPGKDE
jgi:integrase